MVANSNGKKPEPIIEIPPEGSLEKLLYDTEGAFGFALQYKGDEVDKTFSDAGVAELALKFHTYLSAQISRRWNETQKPPRKMWVKIEVDWEEKGDYQTVGILTIGKDDK